MDCEKFDLHVIDALYDELDELTHAALKRHVEGCSRCAGIYSGLRATREVGLLPLEEPSDELEARILDAVAVAQKKTPWPRKLLRGLAWAGSHAMRPQLAMAALFFLVIGSSLLLLRAKPGTVGAPVRVTERGAPSPEPTELAPQAAAAAPAEAAAAATAAPADPIGRAEDKADSPKKEGRAADAAAALADARTTRDTSGCGAAVSKYDEVGARFPGTAAAADAMWEEATCYKSMGNAAKARELYTALRSSPSYRDRAELEIANDANGNLAQNKVAARGPAPAPPAPTAAPSAAANEEQAADDSNRAGGGGAPRAKRAVGGSSGARAAPAPVRAPAKPAAADRAAF